MSSEHDDLQAPGGGQRQQSEPRDPLRLTDPKAMRALAHPVRMALLELFAVNQTLTATQASEALGESPANCAFHLRTLAKYGYLKEAGGGRGRERPWVAVHRSISLSTADQEPQAAVAARSLSQLFIGLVLDRLRNVFAADTWPAGWEDSPQSSTSVNYLTPEETVQVAREMHAVLDRYGERGADPSLRPVGALPVEYSFFGYPRADLAPAGAWEETGK